MVQKVYGYKSTDRGRNQEEQRRAGKKSSYLLGSNGHEIGGGGEEGLYSLAVAYGVFPVGKKLKLEKGKRSYRMTNF